MKCLITGSCVTRDAFEFDADLKSDMVNYHARTSLATLAPSNSYNNNEISTENSEAINRLGSDFQRRMLLGDFTNNVLHSLKENNYDYIVMDLIDERFNLAVVGNKIITKSSEFVLSGIREREVIDSFSEEFYELWCEGATKYISILKEVNALDKLLINQVYWATKLANDEWIDPKKFSPHIIARYNYKMERMYDFLHQLLPPKQFITFTDEILRSDENHKWGLAPFHYQKVYYENLIKFINEK